MLFHHVVVVFAQVTHTPPPHAKEHDELMQLLAKATERSQRIGAVILVTIGNDGRPCVGSNLNDPAFISSLLRQVGGAEDHIASVTEVEIPGTN